MPHELVNHVVYGYVSPLVYDQVFPRMWTTKASRTSYKIDEPETVTRPTVDILAL